MSVQIVRLIIIIAILVVSQPCISATTNNTIWENVAQEKGLNPYDLYAIALVESRRVWNDKQVRPWLYTLMIQGEKNASVFLPDEKSATTLLGLLLENGIDNVDVCCMQINLRTHMDKVERPAELFKLEKCVEIGADILKVALKSTPDRELGLGRYHHWRNENISRAYGKKIVVLAESLKKIKLFD